MEKKLIIPRLSNSAPPFPILPSDTTPKGLHANSHLSFPRSKTSLPNSIDTRLNRLCLNNGPLSEALRILDSAAQQGSAVRPNTFANLLQSCIDNDCILMGREFHSRIGLVTKVYPFVETKLVIMYSKCGCLDEARKVFDEMRERNLFTWSAMIGAYSRNQHWVEVVDLFYDMMEDGFLPGELLLPKIARACGKCRDLETARLIHSLVIRCGLCSSKRVSSSILYLYGRCGEMNCAEKAFGSMDVRDRNRVAWDAMIIGYCHKGEIGRARECFDAMLEEGIEPGLLAWNMLIAGYNRSGHCDVAMDLMRKMESFGITPDIYTWTSMMSGFAQNGRINQTFDLLRQMFLAGIEPTGITIASAASACASLKCLHMGLEIHSTAVKMSLVDNLLVENSLIDMYSNCGNLEAAQQIFDMMLERDAYSWNSIIGGYCQAGYFGKAHELFMKMQESDAQPDVVTWNVMMTGYMKSGDEDQALDLFQRIEKDGKIKPDAASCNSLISGYLQSGQKDKALQIFRLMQSFGIAPNSVTVLTVLPACANLVAGKKVSEIHCCAVRRNLVSERSVSNVLIDAYAKSGNIMYSRKIFDGLSSKDIISWNSLIAGYVLHGCSVSAICLFDQMRKEGFQPSRGTFASVISGYSLAGMVDEAKHAFSSIREEYQIIPGLEHYFAMVNSLGRSGKLAEALEFIQNMPIEPNSSFWAALMSACRIYRNFGMAGLAGERLLELEPGNVIIRHLLSQAYSSCGRSWEAPKPKMTKIEKEKFVRKPVGQCWMEWKSEVLTFVAGDRSKPNSDKLHTWIKRVAVNVKAPVSDNGVCIEEEEKEDIGGVHSEKLAFAFAFIDSHKAPRIIRIVKNIRMCRGCHRTAKYLSSAYGCEIYLSDSNCFHHFKGGHCSCRDYW